MIKANELKPDNLIYFTNPLNNDGKRVVVIDSVKKSIWSFQEKNDHGIDIWLPLSYCEPIPLTPEWLERCGFNEFKKGFYVNYNREDAEGYQLDFLTLRRHEVSSFYELGREHDQYFEVYTQNKHRILHLHQLQNLFYSLTGEELNVKL